MALTMITLTGTLREPVTGAVYVGSVRIRSTVDQLSDPAGNVVYGRVNDRATLDGSGAFSLVVPANDSPDISPAGWLYRLDINARLASGGHGSLNRVRWIELPYDTPGATLDLADITDAVSVPVVVTYATAAGLTAEASARAAADSTLTTAVGAKANQTSVDALATSVTNLDGNVQDLGARVQAVENGDAFLDELHVTNDAAVGGSLSVTGPITTGGTNFFLPLRLGGRFSYAGPPQTGTWAVGDLTVDSDARWWLCTAAGMPGTWTTAP